MGGSKFSGNYTDRARRVVVLAQEESRWMMNDSYIGPEHLLLGLLHAEPDAVQTALGVWPEEVRVAIVRFASLVRQTPQKSCRSPAGLWTPSKRHNAPRGSIIAITSGSSTYCSGC